MLTAKKARKIAKASKTRETSKDEEVYLRGILSLVDHAADQGIREVQIAHPGRYERVRREWIRNQLIQLGYEVSEAHRYGFYLRF